MSNSTHVLSKVIQAINENIVNSKVLSKGIFRSTSFKVHAQGLEILQENGYITVFFNEIEIGSFEGLEAKTLRIVLTERMKKQSEDAIAKFLGD